MTPWAIGHHIGCFVVRKSGKKQLFLSPQAVKAKDYGEIRRRFVFFSLVLPLASMVFFSNPELGEAKMSPDPGPSKDGMMIWIQKLEDGPLGFGS